MEVGLHGDLPRLYRAHARLHPARSDGAPVRRPGGLLRYLLTDVPPLPAASRSTAPPPPPPLGAPSWQPLRECEGARHDHPVMSRPTQDESLCPGCLDALAEAGRPSPEEAAAGGVRDGDG
ncbi:hypothetical protein [Streptomyces sp. MJP52]|uniref:hypothetical protein n=1 Tax=Streptomyces sp. MJP52 TaxID=2940555 RepID=UPI002477274D|nr:hypothetical protein [Streptomyces sp. MJP52]MDH6225489.1 hypothetical protein [Streptomyces sp. MJP52]